MHDAGRELPRVGVDAGVVVQVAVGGLEVDPGRDPPAADGQERQADRARRRRDSSNSRRMKTRLWSPPAVGGKSPRRPSALVEVDEGLEVGERVGRVVEADLADGLGPADLAPDLVALLLAERREVAVEVDALGQRDDRADVLALDVERPALGDLAGTERRGERVSRRVAAAQAAQVDDVPGSAAVGVGEVRRRRPRPRPAGRPVPRGSSRSRRDTRRRRRSPSASGGHGRQVGVGRRGGSSCGSSASAGSTSWRCMSGTIATGTRGRRPARRRRRRRASRRGRWRRRRPTTRDGRPSRERRRPRVRGREAVPGRGREGVERARARRASRGRAAASGTRSTSSPAGQAGSTSRVMGVTLER